MGRTVPDDAASDWGDELSQWAERMVVQAIQSTNLAYGGPAQSVPKLTNALSRQDVPVVLFSRDHRADHPGYAEVASPTVTTWSGLEECLAGDAVQLVHIHGLWNPFQHRIANEVRRRRIPYVVSPRGMLEPWAMGQKRWKKRLAWWLYQRADLQRASLLHATAQSEADQFRRLGLRPRTVVIPNGVDIPDLELLRDGRNASEPSKRVAVFLSRLHPKKGLPMLAEAWARLDTQRWTLRVVGPDVGGHRRELETRLDGLGIRNWEFTGAIFGEDKSRMLRQAELFVLPTYSENFGIAIAEALAHELPVLTTKGTPWDGLKAEGCGWWVDPSVEAIEDALKVALRLDRGELKRMGERGRAWMQRDFRWSVIAETMRSAYVETSRIR